MERAPSLAYLSGGGDSIDQLPQVDARVRLAVSGKFCWGAGIDDVAASVAALRTEIDYVIGLGDNSEVMFHDDHGIAAFDELV